MAPYPRHVPASALSCGLRRGEEESRLTLALTFILGRSVVRTACLPFACGSDGRCSSRAAIRNRVGRGWELGDVSRRSSTGRAPGVGFYRSVSSLLAHV